MIPTNELRFVEREEVLTNYYDKDGGLTMTKTHTIRVLQQKWTGTDTYSGGRKEEWRDVPLVKEET